MANTKAVTEEQLRLELMDGEKRLFERFENLLRPIRDRCDEHSKRIGKLETIVIDLDKIARQLDHKVNGNDQPGLDEIARKNMNAIDQNRKDVDEFKKFVIQMQPVIVFYKVGIWLASALGLSLIALIWGILTHQVSISF